MSYINVYLLVPHIFSFGYAVWRALRGNQNPSIEREYSPPSYLGIVVFILGLALVTYLVRIFIPIGQEALEFPTLAYLPQYLSFFIVGAVAFSYFEVKRGGCAYHAETA